MVRIKMDVEQKFYINHRLRHIAISYKIEAREFDEIFHWCYNRQQEYIWHDSGIMTKITYKTDQDLTAFLLRWS